MMNWNSVAEFIAMGGYGLYVWGSFLTVLAFIVIDVVGLMLRKRAIVRIILQSKKVSQRRN